MKRTRVIVGFALLASFGAGVGAGWLLATGRQPPDRAAAPPAEPATPGVPGDPLGLPSRPPELSGTVEAVEPANQPGFRLLLRSARSGELTYVIVQAGVPVHRRGGGDAGLAVGRRVGVWYSGGVYTTHPPGCFADAVAVEPAG
jgi:hypothetical protein